MAGADEAGVQAAEVEHKYTGSSERSSVHRAGMEEVDLMEFGGRSMSKSAEIKENGVSLSESSSRASSAHVTADEDPLPAFKSSRATSDSGISVSGKMAADLGDAGPAYESERSSHKSAPAFSGPYAYAEDRRSADELIKRILADSDLEPSPNVSRKYKVDMGGGGRGGDAASYTTEESSEFDDQSFVDHHIPERRQQQEGRQSLLERRLENLNREQKSASRGEQSEYSSTYSRDNRHEEDSRVHTGASHRLGEDEGEVFLNEETIYMKKLPKDPKPVEEEEGEVFINEETIYMRKNPGGEKAEGDEFACEVAAMKNKYKEGQSEQDMEFLPGMEDLPQPPPGAHGGMEDHFGARGMDHLNAYGTEGTTATRGHRGQYGVEEEDSYSAYSSSRSQRRYLDEEESMSNYSMRSGERAGEDEMGLVPYKPRGRMFRQPYVDDDDVFYEHTPEPERPPVLPDEAFMPQRSADTEDIVNERTQEIKRVVEQQGDVVKKLKEAADSFDELSKEIKKMKQEFIERQVTRQITLEEVMRDDDEDAPLAIEYEPDTKPRRYGGRPLAITSGQEYDHGASSSSASSYRSSYRSDYARSLDYGSSSLSSSRPRYGAGGAEDVEDGDDNQFGKGLTSLASRGYGNTDFSSSTAYGYKRKNFLGSRSKSLYDDVEDDASSYSGRYDGGLDANEDSETTPSYSRKYGSYAASREDSETTPSYSRKYGSYAASQDDTESTASGYTRKYGSRNTDSTATEGNDALSGYRRRFSLQNDDTASTASGDPDKDVDEEVPSYRRSYKGSSAASSSYSSATSSYRSPYGSNLGAGATDTSGYSPTPSRSSRFQRSQTLSDFDFSSSRSSYGSSSFGSGITDKPFSSRFLNKVRENKVAGISSGASAEVDSSASIAATKRDKPFKSRFLRSTFDSGSSYSSSSSRFGSSARSSSVTDLRSNGAKSTGDSTTAE